MYYQLVKVLLKHSFYIDWLSQDCAYQTPWKTLWNKNLIELHKKYSYTIIQCVEEYSSSRWWFLVTWQCAILTVEFMIRAELENKNGSRFSEHIMGFLRYLPRISYQLRIRNNHRLCHSLGAVFGKERAITSQRCLTIITLGLSFFLMTHRTFDRLWRCIRSRSDG